MKTLYNIRSWLRKVLPLWVIPIPFLVIFFIELLIRRSPPHSLNRCEWTSTQFITYIILCGVYGFYRILHTHPLFNEHHLKWLESIPWTSRRDLPLQPVRIVFQDILLLGLFELAAHGCSMSSVPLFRELRLPGFVFFLLPYLVVCCFALFLTETPRWGFGLLFGFGVLAFLGNRKDLWLPPVVLLYIVAYLGLRRSLSFFPWDVKKYRRLIYASMSNLKSLPERKDWKECVWPLSQLRPNKPQPVSLQTSILVSLLAGWYFFIPLYHYFRLGDIACSFLLGGIIYLFVVITCLFGRLVLYTGMINTGICVPPMNIWGRIFNLRLIIPGYHRIYLPVILTLVTSIALPLLLRRFGIYRPSIIPISATIVIFLSLWLGPTREKWLMTGHYRMTKPPKAKIVGLLEI